MKGQKTNGRHGTAPRSIGRPGGRPRTSLWIHTTLVTILVFVCMLNGCDDTRCDI